MGKKLVIRKAISLLKPISRFSQLMWRAVAIVGFLSLFVLTTAQAAIVKVSITNQKGAPLSNAVVTFNAIGLDGDESKDEKAVIAQIDKEFVPEVTVVQAGTSITFPNNDDILHHVYSFSESKTFDLPLYKDTPPEPVIFNKPGLVTLGCNIHDWMRAYVVVVDTPFYQTSNDEGIVVIKDIPVGDYQLEIWHPKQRKAYTEDIYVGLQFSLEVEITTKPQLRSRRHSSSQGDSYN